MIQNKTYADERRELEALEPSEQLLRVEIARATGQGWRWAGVAKLVEWASRVFGWG